MEPWLPVLPDAPPGAWLLHELIRQGADVLHEQEPLSWEAAGSRFVCSPMADAVNRHAKPLPRDSGRK